MIIRPRRPLWQRAINRITHRHGIKLFPVAFDLSLETAGEVPSKVFEAIYASNYWESSESKSGAGSSIAATRRYVEELVGAIQELDIKSVFDAPCGDLNWIGGVVDRTRVDYHGGDIAREAIALAKVNRPDLDVRLFDICADPMPDVDLWHCRDTFFHLSFADIRRALTNVARSEIRYVALTTHRARYLRRNMDIETGGFRLLDLERAPFGFPPALRYLRDHESHEFPRVVGIWELSALRAHLPTGRSANR